MIQLKISKNASQILAKHKKVATAVSRLLNTGAAKPFLVENQANYQGLAQAIVVSEVYNAYVPKTYQRTWELFKAVNLVMDTPNRFHLGIELSAALKMVSPNSRHTYYPALVILGITSRYVPGYPKRDFLNSTAGWKATFNARFAQDFYSLIQKSYS